MEKPSFEPRCTSLPTPQQRDSKSPDLTTLQRSAWGVRRQERWARGAQGQGEGAAPVVKVGESSVSCFKHGDSFTEVTVLAHSSCYNKSHRLGAYKEQKLIAHISEGWKSEIRAKCGQVGTLFHVADFSSCPHMGEAAKELVGIGLL